MKKITTFAGIKVGQKFKVIKNNMGHNYPIDTILTFKVPGTQSVIMTNIAEENPYGNSINASCIELVNYTVEDMQKEQKELLKQVEDLQERIDYCKSLGIKEYDENLVKVLKTMAILKGLDSDIEKAKQIATLIGN